MTDLAKFLNGIAEGIDQQVEAIVAREGEESVESLALRSYWSQINAVAEHVGDDERIDWSAVADRVHIDPAEDAGPRFGEVELTPFRTDAEGDWPSDTVYLYELPDGRLFEDAEGRLFNKVGHGPVQGSVEIVDDDETHAYFDTTIRVKPHGE